MVTIGVLDLQGGVEEHISLLRKIPEVETKTVKKKKDFNSLDGLILPGGESTTISKLITIFDLKECIINLAASNIPIWGTCAGMILLAKNIIGAEQSHLKLMDITVKRNAYGNQLASFKTTTIIPEISQQELPLVFIRAPYIVQKSNSVTTLLKLDNKIVAAEQNNLFATAFHPELTNNPLVHNYFVQKVKQMG
ncbi:MAG: pyridoxal 5'-phosphate synthase glutaminase subunit PdxT [Bacillota bacterium]